MARDAGLIRTSCILIAVTLIVLGALLLAGDAFIDLFASAKAVSNTGLILAAFAFIMFGMLLLAVRRRFSKDREDVKPIPEGRQRSFTLVLGVGYFYGTVNGLLFITLPIYVNELSNDLFLVGLTVSLPFLAIFVMSFVWGAITDALGSRKGVLAVSMAIHGLLYLPMPFLDIYSLIALRAVQVFFASSNSLGMALVTELAPETKGEAVGNVGEWTAAGWLMGGVVSGFVYYYGDVVSLFPLCFVIGVLGGLVIIPMREPVRARATDIMRGLFRFKHGREIGFICSIVVLVYLSNNIVFTLFPVYLKEMSLTEDVIGVLTASAGLIGAMVVAYVGRLIDRIGRRPILILAVLLYFLDWLVLVVTQNLIIVTLIWVVPIWAFIMVSGTTMVSDLTTPDERGRGVGALNSALNLGSFLGSALSGAVAYWIVEYLPDLGPYRSAFLFATLFTLIPIALVLKVKETLPKKERDRAPSEEE